MIRNLQVTICLLISLLSIKHSDAQTVSYTFSASGIQGSGFQNVIAVNPSGKLILVGGDVCGFHRSIDYGKNLITSNGKLNNRGRDFHIASIVFSNTIENKVYAGSGQTDGSTGGFLVSIDGGESWAERSTIKFSGGNSKGYGGLPETHPRSTGNLIALDEKNGFIYAATFEDGLKRSSDDGKTWLTLGLNGKFLRSLAKDPKDPDILYVSAYNNKVWKVSNAGSNAILTQLQNAPATVEELVFIGDVLYAAAGLDGIYKASSDGTSWSRLYNASGTAIWMSIDGYVAKNGESVIFAGCSSPIMKGEMCQSIIKSTDGGVSWESMTSEANRVHAEIGGPGGEIWSHAINEPQAMIGKNSFVASQITIDHIDNQRVYVAGRAGLWKSENGGLDWYPLVKGLRATINHGVAADSKLNGRVFVANTDWRFYFSINNLQYVQAQEPQGSSSAGFDVVVDPYSNPGCVYLALGARDSNIDGEIYSNSDPANDEAWVNEELSLVTGGNRPRGVAIGEDNGSTIILAAVENSGIWRKAGGSWSQVNTSMNPDGGPFDTVNFSWLPNTNTLYVFERTSGVWRSNDAGKSWTKIWKKPATGLLGTGYVAVNPDHPNQIFVSTGDGLYRLNNANLGTVDNGSINPENMNLELPGPIAMKGQNLYVATHISDKTDPGIWLSSNEGDTWTNLADDYYKKSGAFPIDLAIGADDYIYISTYSVGVMVGNPEISLSALNRLPNGSDNSFKVYPNPFRESFILEMKVTDGIKAELISVELYNTIGEKIYSENIDTTYPVKKIINVKVNPGIYYLKLNKGNKNSCIKLIHVKNIGYV